MHNRTSVAGQRAGIDCGCELRGSQHVGGLRRETGERLDLAEVRKGRAKEVRELDEFEVKMEVDESEMRVTPGKKIGSKWVETRKDPNSPAVRCRLCATEVNTDEPRSDTFAATPPLKFVRLILNWAASYKPRRANASMITAVFDISVAFFHGKDLRKRERSGGVQRTPRSTHTRALFLAAHSRTPDVITRLAQA